MSLSHNISKYYQMISKAEAEVLQELTVLRLSELQSEQLSFCTSSEQSPSTQSHVQTFRSAVHCTEQVMHEAMVHS